MLTGKLRVYWEKNDAGKYEVRNWSGSFRIPVHNYRVSHRWFNGVKLRRTDFWGVFQGCQFHGVHIMNGGTLATIKLKKAKS